MALLRSKHGGGIHRHGPERRPRAGDADDPGDDDADDAEGHGIRRGDAEEKTREKPGEEEGRAASDQQADGREPQGLPEDEPKDVTPGGPECGADADLAPALSDPVGDDPVDADRREKQGQAAEEPE